MVLLVKVAGAIACFIVALWMAKAAFVVLAWIWLSFAGSVFLWMAAAVIAYTLYDAAHDALRSGRARRHLPKWFHR